MTVRCEIQDEGGSSDGEDGRKGHNLVGSRFEDPGDGTCDVAGYGEVDSGARILFYKLPDGEEVYGAVKEVRVWVLAHRAANKRGSAGKINVPVPYSNMTYNATRAIVMTRI